VHLAQHLAARTETASVVLARKEIHRQLQLAIGGLSDEDREVILMRHFEELTNQEVAEALGIKPTTATMRHGRALARLKEQLAKQSAFGDMA
jgi:RNA polymerase sigma-70 factor (ECF subfamily)